MGAAATILQLKTATILRSSQQLYRELKRAERLEPAELRKLQRQRAIDHARFAMANTEYYRQRYSDAGFTLEDLRDPDAFESLPIVEKSEVREHGDLFKSSESTDRNSKVSATGGSTGEPLKLLRDLRFQARALEWRLYDWWGVSAADDIAVVYRFFRTSRDSRVQRLLWFPARRFQLDAFDITDQSIDQFLQEWGRTPPALLIGYVGGVAEVARNLLDRNLHLQAPRAVAVTAAPLQAAQRVDIETAFRAPVYDHYRSAEIPWMAGQCAQRQGLHVFADVRVLEILGQDGKQAAAGVTGEVVVTDLTNRVFPLIRYRLGDRTSMIDEACTCGVTLPRIAPVMGRVSEALRLPDGTVIAGESLTGIFAQFAGTVRQFQVHQHADHAVTVRCVPGLVGDPETIMTQVTQRVRDLTKHAVPVTLEVVGDIPHVGGKLKFIQSDVL